MDILPVPFIIIVFLLPHILNVVVPAFIVILILTILNKAKVYSRVISFRWRIVVGIGVGLTFAFLIFLWKGLIKPEEISDLGKPCIHSAMCQGKCWTSDAELPIKDTVQRYGVFVVGGCGYNQHTWGCGGEVNWGIESFVMCIDPVF